MLKKERFVVIMAGGIGSRFWPMSTPTYPKQFIDVMGVGKSLLQLTVSRLLPLCPIDNFYIVTSEKYVEIVKNQIPELPIHHILAEPEARNTAPCIGYACWKIVKKHTNANIIVTPSDAMVIDTLEFKRVLTSALNFTESHEAIVTIGITPNRPETGYGYIHTEERGKDTDLIKVRNFKEKPNLETAEKYLASGNYYWNSGIFIWNIDTIIKALRTYTPDLASIMDKMAVDFYTDKEKETVKRLFPTCQKISIDYAVMEKSKEIYTIPADFGWSDLGSWKSLHSLLPKDEKHNAVIGANVSLYNSQNCIIHTHNEHQIVIEGLDGYIIAERGNRLLICRLDEEQKIKDFVTK